MYMNWSFYKRTRSHSRAMVFQYLRTPLGPLFSRLPYTQRIALRGLHQQHSATSEVCISENIEHVLPHLDLKISLLRRTK